MLLPYPSAARPTDCSNVLKLPITAAMWRARQAASGGHSRATSITSTSAIPTTRSAADG